MGDRPLIAKLAPLLAGGALLLISGGIGASVLPLVWSPPKKNPAAAAARKVIEAPDEAKVAVAAYLRPEQLEELAASLGDDPVAAQTGRAFMASPALAAHWRAYRQDGDFSAFYHKLADEPDFQALRAQAAQNEQARVALSPLVLDPRVLAMQQYAENHEHDPAPRVAAATSARPVDLEFDQSLVDSDMAFRRRSHRASVWLFGFGAALAALTVLAVRFRRRVQIAAAEPAEAAPAAEEDEPPAPAAPAAAGLANKYDIVRVLARGDAAQLLEARDKKLDRLVMVHRLAGGDAARRQALSAAPRAAAAIRHPALLDVYEILEDGEDVCVVYERCRGRTVAELVSEQGPMPPARAAEVLEPACLALELAHARGVFHRWLALERLLVTEQGFTKIIGLGMSRAMGGDGRAEDIRALGSCLERMLGPGAPPALQALVRDAAGAPQRVATAAEFLSRLKRHPTSPARA